jgi:hypothetical protein
MYRPSLPPGISWYSFLENESTPGQMELSDAPEKIPSDRGSIPGPSDYCFDITVTVVHGIKSDYKLCPVGARFNVTVNKSKLNASHGSLHQT